MTDYTALIAKWGTLTGTTQAKLDAINALTVQGPNVPVPVLQVMTYLRTNNLWMQIKGAVGTSPGAAAAADYNSDPRVQTLDVSLPIVQGMLTDLVTRGLLNQAQSDVIKAMGTPQTAWWQATVAQGGGGLDQPVGQGYLNNAGLS